MLYRINYKYKIYTYIYIYRSDIDPKALRTSSASLEDPSSSMPSFRYALDTDETQVELAATVESPSRAVVLPMPELAHKPGVEKPMPVASNPRDEMPMPKPANNPGVEKPEPTVSSIRCDEVPMPEPAHNPGVEKPKPAVSSNPGDEMSMPEPAHNPGVEKPKPLVSSNPCSDEVPMPEPAVEKPKPTVSSNPGDEVSKPELAHKPGVEEPKPTSNPGDEVSMRHVVPKAKNPNKNPGRGATETPSNPASVAVGTTSTDVDEGRISVVLGVS